MKKINYSGYVPLSQTGAEMLFEVFSQRYERGSTIVTSNLPLDEWTSVFGSELRIPTEPATYSNMKSATSPAALPVGLWARRRTSIAL